MKNFLLTRTNKEVLIFFFFLALSGVFWLMMTLNETYEKEVSIVVRYANVRKNAVLTSTETDTVRVTISDKGFNILSYIYGKVHKPINIDFTAHALNDGTGKVGSSEVKAIVTEELPASSKIITIKPERLYFYYNNGESKKVPVIFRGTPTPQPLYYVTERQLTPDSVTIYASRQKLDSIKAVYTEEQNYRDLRDTVVVTARVCPIAEVKIVPNHVDIRFVTDVLAEVRIDNIPIEGINMPAGKRLRTFPAKTGVSCVTGMRTYQSLKPEDFRIVADYYEFSQGASQKCNIFLDKMPKGVTNAKLDINQVDYLIEGTD